jgi:hypothetical protein
MSRAVLTRMKCRLVITSGRNGRRKAVRHWTGVCRRGYEEAGQTIRDQSDRQSVQCAALHTAALRKVYRDLMCVFSYSCTRIGIKIRMHKLNSLPLNLLRYRHNCSEPFMEPARIQKHTAQHSTAQHMNSMYTAQHSTTCIREDFSLTQSLLYTV